MRWENVICGSGVDGVGDSSCNVEWSEPSERRIRWRLLLVKYGPLLLHGTVLVTFGGVDCIWNLSVAFNMSTSSTGTSSRSAVVGVDAMSEFCLPADSTIGRYSDSSIGSEVCLFPVTREHILWAHWVKPQSLTLLLDEKVAITFGMISVAVINADKRSSIPPVFP